MGIFGRMSSDACPVFGRSIEFPDSREVVSRRRRMRYAQSEGMNDSEAQRRAAMFVSVRPLAYANEVSDSFEPTTRSAFVQTRNSTNEEASQMFDAKPMTESKLMPWARPTYQALADAQAEAHAHVSRRNERHGSVESDHTTHDGGGPRGEGVRKSVDEEEEDDSPRPEAGVTCACCRTQKTPLWRNGPTGSKTLCNACGVRFKAGRVVADDNGNVFPLAPQGRKRAVQITPHRGGENYVGPPFKRAKPKHSSSTYTHHLEDGRLYELKRVPDSEGDKHTLPRLHSATILTDYDGAVLLMLLHGDGDDEESDS